MTIRKIKTRGFGPRRHRRRQNGIAAMEFALMCPMLISMVMGGVDLSLFLIVHQKVERVTYTLADLVAQSENVTLADLNQLMVAADEIMEPYDFGSQGSLIVSSVYKETGVANPKVRWQYKNGSLVVNSTTGAVNANAVLPSSLTLNDKDNVIVAEVSYRYEPMFLGEVFGIETIAKNSYFKTRLGALITAPS
jgi:Flp pilus assembly protein TadG